MNSHREAGALENLPISRAQGPLVQAAVEAELSWQLSEGGLGPELTAGGAVPSVRADGIDSVGKSPSQIGRQITRSVYGGMIR